MAEKAFLRYPQLTIAEPSRHRLSLLRTRRIDPEHRQGLENLLGDTHAERDIAARIEEACRGALFHVTDVTDALRAVEIDGRRAGDLIAKGCSLDLHPTVFRMGQAKRSLLGQIRVLLHRISASRYRIYFDVSVHEHVMQWLKVSAEEFRHDVVLEDAE